MYYAAVLPPRKILSKLIAVIQEILRLNNKIVYSGQRFRKVVRKLPCRVRRLYLKGEGEYNFYDG